MRSLSQALSSLIGDAVVHVAPGTSTSGRLDVALAEDIDATLRALADAQARGVPFVLVSRLSAIANRKGLLPEALPTLVGAGSDKPIDFDAELQACRDAAIYVRASSSFADQLSKLADETKRELRDLGGASSGSAFTRAFERGKERELARAMERALVDRADGWRYVTSSTWATRGYTNALAELVVARAAGTEARPTGSAPMAPMAPIAVAIVRVPALFSPDDGGVLDALLDEVERRSALAPLALPADMRLEALPVDVVARAIGVVVQALRKSPDSTVKVVQLTGPVPGPRLADLLALHDRRGTGRSKSNKIAKRSVVGAQAILGGAASLARAFVDTARDGGVSKLMSAMRDGAEVALSPTGAVRLPSWLRAPPFFVEDARFSTRNLRLFAARAGVDAPSLDVDWRATLLGDVLPALDDGRAARARAVATAPRPAWDSLPHLLDESAARYGSRPALSLIKPASEGDEIVDVSYAELRARAHAVARRLHAAGVQPGDRVVLSGANHPAWGIVAFGVACARAVLVPLDPNLEEPQVANIAKKARPTLAVLDRTTRERFGAALGDDDGRPSSDAGSGKAHFDGARSERTAFSSAGVRVLDLHLTAAEGSELERDDAPLTLPARDELASVLFTSGTTGDPKGVMLSHGNFTSLLSSLQAIFPVGQGDRMLSVLPLHHTFEFSCGLLMPLASGARIYTPDALTGERVLFALKAGKITALVGVPALWQLLERRISKQAAERGELVEGVLKALLAANRAFAKRTGKSFGRVVLKPIHDQLGGHLRTIISGGSALPPGVHDMFQGLGLPLAEGYGLTEAAPVLTVAEGVHGAPAGTVGRPIPGVELRIVDADEATGVGEVWARAPNVMRGYFEDEVATSAALSDGWLKTGDLGLIDADGRLRLVGRSKDVVITASGENIYLDDAEKKLEGIEHVTELTLLGMPDLRGGERLACAFVASTNDEVGRTRALKSLQARLLKLPAWSRPAIIEAVDGPLPLTATRKVKRKEVRRAVEDILAKRADAAPASADEAPMAAVRAAIALVAGVEARKISGSTRPAQDLGFDSLMWVELGSSLETIAGKLDPEKLVACESVADLEAMIRSGAGTASGAAPGLVPVERMTIDTPSRPTLADVALPFVKPLGRAAITFMQREAYRSVFDAKVTGQAFIPHNRNAIVVANHTSHLDTGLVKFALGSFGKDLRPLAAKDYFFEGARAKVAFFEHFTNLVPIDRETGSGLAFEQARAVVEGGHVTLIFPEGTRREDGTLGGFKPLVARLSLSTGVDVLPIWMKGNYEALPRGVHVPRMDARHLEAHIGPPLEAKEMARLTAHLAPVQAARASTEIIRKAIVALSEGRMLELTKVRALDDLQGGAGLRARL